MKRREACGAYEFIAMGRQLELGARLAAEAQVDMRSARNEKAATGKAALLGAQDRQRTRQVARRSY